MSISGRTASPDIALADDVTHDAATKALLARGVDQPEALLELSAATTILGWCRWFDEQGQLDKRVLAARIRSGQQPPITRKSVTAQQQEYGEQIVRWLRKHFPEWNRNDGNRTHTAAIAAVIRLHHRHGKGQLTKREHGREIRDAVAQWERTFAPDEDQQEA